MDCVSGESVGCADGERGTCSRTFGSDFYDIRNLLSVGRKIVFSEERQASAVFDFYGIAGDFWRLFFFYCGEFYDRTKQAGKSGTRKYYDSDVDLSVVFICGISSGRTEDTAFVLGIVA